MTDILAAPPAVPDLLGTAPADLIDPSADQPVATRDTAVRRAERIRAGVASYAAMRQDIADAYAQSDWLALDYHSWYEYLDGEFGEELRKLARDDRREAVRDLRAQGMSTRQIAATTGVAQTQVVRDLAQVNTKGSPEGRVTGADGKTYASTRPRTEPPAVSSSRPDQGEAAAAGQVAAASPAATPEPAWPKPPAWDPEERRQHEEEVRRIQMIDAARREAKTIVTTVLAAVSTVVGGSRLGERGLVTRDMVAKLREAIDLLEGEIDDEG